MGQQNLEFLGYLVIHIVGRAEPYAWLKCNASAARWPACFGKSSRTVRRHANSIGWWCYLRRFDHAQDVATESLLLVEGRGASVSNTARLARRSGAGAPTLRRRPSERRPMPCPWLQEQ